MDIESIKLIVSDFDGVMTDNSVYLDETGLEMVRVSRADGQGINLLRDKGIEVIILSTEENTVVKKRALKLKVECVQGIKDKAAAFLLICKDKGLQPKEVAYVGNDINDYEAMKLAGLKIVPNDAYDEVIKIADIVTNTKGGRGVIREIASLIC